MEEAQVVNVRDAFTQPPTEDETTEEYRRQFKVELAMMPWLGSSMVTEEESTILVTRNVRINGHLMRFESDPPPKDPEPGTYIIDQGEAKIEIGAFALIYLRRLTPESRAALEVTENDWMEQTTDDTLVLPVSLLTVRNLTKDDYRDEPESF